MGLDDATKKMIDDEKKATYEMTKEGDKYKCVTTFTKLPQEIVTFKLDEKFMEDTMGMKVENLFKLEGDIIVGYHTIIGADGKRTETTTKRFLKDGVLIVESSAPGGVVMKSVMNKM